MLDSYRHRGLRQNLIQELQRKGIKDVKVLQAMLNIPRHLFIDQAFDDWAYKDIAFPIDAEQTISQPYTVAFQTSLLELKGKEKVLEIGTGSGYQAAVIAEIGAKIYSIERQESLYKKTTAFLEELGYGRIRTLFGDGYFGSPRFAPFDRILVTAGATEVPTTLVEQLKIGGMMVIPVGDSDNQEMQRIIRTSKDDYETTHYGTFSFVPFLSGVNTL